VEFWEQVTLSILALVGGLTTALFMLKFALRKECNYRLEGIQDDGNVVELCDHCQKRRVFTCQPGERVKMMLYTDREWADGLPGTEIEDGKV